MNTSGAPFNPGTADVNPTSTVEISISCRNLVDKDILSKSDPMCAVFHKPIGANRFIELLRTEVIWDNLNPDFATKLTIEYRFEENQPLRFEVYDVDSPSPILDSHDFLGCFECSLAHIVAAGPEGLTSSLSRTRQFTGTERNDRRNVHSGSITLMAEELASLKDEVTLKLGGSEMGALVWCVFSPVVQYTISKLNDAEKYVVVHRSNDVSSQNPTWQPSTISMRSLCNGDKDRTLKIECHKLQMGGNRRLIGHCITTLNQLQQIGTGALRLFKPDGKETNSTLLVLQCLITPIYTFVDYIQSGTQIHSCLAIDFTASNGDPSSNSSLHFFSSGPINPNPYEQAIQSIWPIIQDYDSKQMFPVYGFGARIPPQGVVSHNFPVTLSESPYCVGFPGIMEAYHNCIRQIQMSGPTNFSPIINLAAHFAAQNQDGQAYYILLIITDGIITDMPKTQEAIVNASTLPLSIIIVGVGSADFTAMEVLDGDALRLSSNGRFAARDIVQFVPYRSAHSWLASTLGPGYSASLHGAGGVPPNHLGGLGMNTDATHKLAQTKLAQEVLAEIPAQLTSYMKSQGIIPGIRR